MTHAVTIRAAFAEQGRVLHALLLREIRTRFGSRRIGYAWALVEPALHVSVMYALRSVTGGLTPAHVPLLLWLITGIVPFFMFRSIVLRMVNAVSTNQTTLALPPVKLMDVLWARVLLEIATYSGILIVFLMLAGLLIEPVAVSQPLEVMGCMFMLAALGMGYGMIAMTFIAVFPSTKPLLSGILRMLYFMSGTIFSVSRLHPDLYPYLTWNPLLHVFESLHAAFFIEYTPVPFASDLSYAGAFALLMLLLGKLLVQRFKRQVMEV